MLTACFAVGMVGGWLGERFNNSAYDRMSQALPLENANPQSVVVAIDEDTLKARGGQREIRSILAEAILNHKSSHYASQGSFTAYSAGSHPSGAVRPEALKQLERSGIST